MGQGHSKPSKGELPSAPPPSTPRERDERIQMNESKLNTTLANDACLPIDSLTDVNNNKQAIPSTRNTTTCSCCPVHNLPPVFNTPVCPCCTFHLAMMKQDQSSEPMEGGSEGKPTLPEFVMVGVPSEFPNFSNPLATRWIKFRKVDVSVSIIFRISSFHLQSICFWRTILMNLTALHLRN